MENVTLLIWIMSIGAILIFFFKTFVKVEVRDVDDYINDEAVPTKEKDAVISKTLKTLIEATNKNIQQLDTITKYMSSQDKLNKSSNNVFKNLLHTIQLLEEDVKLLKDKNI